MKHSLLNNLLSLLNSRDWRVLLTAASSEYFNSNKNITQFLYYIKPFIIKDHQFPSDEEMYIASGLTPPFSASKMRLLASDTLELAEMVFAIEHVFSDKTNYRKYIVEMYRNREISKNRITHLRRSIKEVQKKSYSVYVMDDLHLIEMEIYHLKSEQRSAEDLNIETLMSTADHAFIARKLQLLCYALSHQQIVQHDYDLQLVEAVLDYVSKNCLWEHPLVGAYYYAFHALKSNDEVSKNNYWKLKEVVLKSTTAIDMRELRDLVILAINYCILQYRGGRKEFSHEVFQWYKFGIDEGPLTHQNRISPYTYRNAATVAIIFDSLEWAASFTEKYKPLLPSKFQDNMYGFNMARIAYKRGDYSSARDHLWNVDFEDVLLILASRTLLLKIYFLIREYALLDSTIDSLRAFLMRKKIARSHSASYLKFVKYMKRMSRWQQSHKDQQEDQRIKLKNKIEADKVFPEKTWFLDQLGSMS